MKLTVPLIALVTVALLGAAATFGRRVGRFLAVDLAVTCQMIAEGLIRFACRRIPRAHRERYYDEWVGELDALRRENRHEAAFSLILFALRVLLRSGSTGRAVSNIQPQPERGAAASPPEQEPEPSIGSPLDDLVGYWNRSSSQLPLWRESSFLQDADFLEAIRENRKVRIERWRLERYLNEISSQVWLANGQGKLFESVDLFEIRARRAEDES